MAWRIGTACTEPLEHWHKWHSDTVSVGTKKHCWEEAFEVCHTSQGLHINPVGEIMHPSIVTMLEEFWEAFVNLPRACSSGIIGCN